MLRFAVFVLLVLMATAVRAEMPAPQIAARAWLLADLSSGQLLGETAADERVEPASLTKLMTAYLVFAALRDRKISIDQQANVSVRAWKAPGSRMFIEPRKPVSVEELIKGMVVQSGNDACVALAELVAGSEEAFVEQMNREAARLGMKNSRFANSSGLPDAEHYTTARDLLRLATALIRDFPEPYARYYSLKEYSYNRITQPNRNRLLWLDSSVDGVKTGHTAAAGYCLIASSRREERRLVSVLLGAGSEAARAQESLKLLNWGYQAFDAVKLYSKGQSIKTIQVWKGVAKEVNAGIENDIVLTVGKGDASRIKADLVSQTPLMAPLAAGQRIGTLRVTLADRTLGEYPVVALAAVEQAGFMARTWDTLKLWVK